MQFDVIIGNPPYQEEDGGGAVVVSAQPLYNEFYKWAISTNAKLIVMLMPARWLCGGKQKLMKFRKDIVESKHITDMVVYLRNKGIFEDVDIAGGVLYILFNSKVKANGTNIVSKGDLGCDALVRELTKYKYINNGIEEYIIPPDNMVISIVDKVLNNSNNMMLSDIVLSRSPFGLGSNFTGNDIETDGNDIEVMCSNKRVTWTNRDNIVCNRGLVDKYNVIIGKMSSGYPGIRASIGYANTIISKPRILNRKQVCTETYLVLDSFDSIEDAKLFSKYINTKLVRYLIYATLTGANMTKKNFMFVPFISIPELRSINDDMDTYLINKYGLTDIEVRIMDSTVDNFKRQED